MGKEREFSVPKVIKDYCEVFFGESGEENIQMHIYKWAGTDRITILWNKLNKTRYSAVGKMELHYYELYKDVGELIEDRGYLTKVMKEQGWGVLDLRDLNAVREFGEDFS